MTVSIPDFAARPQLAEDVARLIRRRIFDGTYPYQLPSVDLDTSDAECSYGWNFVRDIETGFKIVGMWRTGRPNAVISVEADLDAIERGTKCRRAYPFEHGRKQFERLCSL